MKPMIFIGDVGGEFATLMKLIDNCPKGRDILLLGDLNDRGPRSREVIEWAMANPEYVDSLYSNHGDIMVDWYLKTGIYKQRIWLTHNGGDSTLMSYGAEHVTTRTYMPSIYSAGPEEFCTNEGIAEDEEHRKLIPPEHIEWLRTRPLFLEDDGWIATHAPINPTIPWPKFIDIHRLPVQDPQFEDTVIWNRGGTRRRPGQYQIHGHTHGLALYKDKRGEYGCGIDTSGGRNRCLTALLWPEKTFVQLEFIR